MRARTAAASVRTPPRSRRPGPAHGVTLAQRTTGSALDRRMYRHRRPRRSQGPGSRRLPPRASGPALRPRAARPRRVPPTQSPPLATSAPRPPGSAGESAAIRRPRGGSPPGTGLLPGSAPHQEWTRSCGLTPTRTATTQCTARSPAATCLGIRACATRRHSLPPAATSLSHGGGGAACRLLPRDTATLRHARC